MDAIFGCSQASHCLSVTARLDGQQTSLMCSVRDHAERAKDLMAQQIGGVMESVGEALEVGTPPHAHHFLLISSSVSYLHPNYFKITEQLCKNHTLY